MSEDLFDFGRRYRGARLRDIPTPYIDWFLRNVRACELELRERVVAERERRREIETSKAAERSRRRAANRDPMGWGGPRNGG